MRRCAPVSPTVPWDHNSRRLLAVLLALPWLVGAVSAQEAPPAARSDSLWSTVLQVLGISANPGSLKGGSTVDAGELWVAAVQGGAPTRIAQGVDYRSPLFLPRGKDLVALRGDALILLASPYERERTLLQFPGALRLVGFVDADPDRLLVLAAQGGGPALPWVLSLVQGDRTALPYDPQSAQDRALVERLSDERRSYPGVELYVQRVHGNSMSGPEEWNDVFLARKGQEPVDVSGCRPLDCGQPALSADGKSVAYLRRPDE